MIPCLSMIFFHSTAERRQIANSPAPRDCDLLRAFPLFPSSSLLLLSLLSGCIITAAEGCLSSSSFFCSLVLCIQVPLLHSITMAHPTGTSTCSLHADDALNVVSDVAPPMHLSTNFRYSDDPSALVPIADLTGVCNCSVFALLSTSPISLATCLHTLAIYIVNVTVCCLI